MTESQSWVAQLQQDAERRLDDVMAAQEALVQVRGEARSARGEVTASAAPSGVPSGLELSDAALRMRPTDLAALILATQQHAAADAGRRAAEVLAPVLGREQAEAMLSARLTPDTVDKLRRQRDAMRGPEAPQDGAAR